MASKDITGCIPCRKYPNIGCCVFNNDLVNSVLEKMITASGMVVGSPVYYCSANGTVIAFFDHLFQASRGRFSGKPGAAVVSARRAGTSASLDQLMKYFLYTNMPVVSSQYWSMVHGNTPEEFLQDTEGLQIYVS